MYDKLGDGGSDCSHSICQKTTFGQEKCTKVADRFKLSPILEIPQNPRRFKLWRFNLWPFYIMAATVMLMERDDLGEPKLQWAQSTSCWLCTVSVLPPVR